MSGNPYRPSQPISIPRSIKCSVCKRAFPTNKAYAEHLDEAGRCPNIYQPPSPYVYDAPINEFDAIQRTRRPEHRVPDNELAVYQDRNRELDIALFDQNTSIDVRRRQERLRQMEIQGAYERAQQSRSQYPPRPSNSDRSRRETDGHSSHRRRPETDRHTSHSSSSSQQHQQYRTEVVSPSSRQVVPRARNEEERHHRGSGSSHHYYRRN